IYTKAGYESVDSFPIFAFSNVNKAKEFVNDLIKENNLQDFRLLDTLECINLQNVNNVIIVSFFEESEESENTLTNIVNAIEAFKKAKHKTG
ncbi:phage tail sheath family protein, partial [Campylobacter jejuni]|nr:phage tail sheath family protein [Campylobacter jejuni]